MRRRFVVGLVLASMLVACEPPPPPYTPAAQKTTQDPDKLYAAGVRVLLKRGYGFTSRDADARAMETDWRPLGQMGLTEPDHRKVGKVRILVSRDQIDVSTQCAFLDEGKIRTDGVWGLTYCTGTIRPAGVIELEQALVKEVLAEVDSLAGGKLIRSDNAPDASAPPAAGGCTKDTDCKGDRICERGECTAPH